MEKWPQQLLFKQPMPAGRQPRNLVVAVTVSMVIHVFLVYLLCVVIADRTAVVGPTPPSIGTFLIVSLNTLPTPSHGGLDREAVPEVPHTDPPPPAQRSQSTPERSRSAEQKAVAETVVASKDHAVPDSEGPEDKSLTTDETPSIDPEVGYRIAQEVGRMPESGAETVVSSKGQGIPGSDAPVNESFATDVAPSIDLEAAYSIAREVGRLSMSAPDAQTSRFTTRKLYLKNHLGIIRMPLPDCRTFLVNNGFLAIPFLIVDTVTDRGCTWQRQPDRKRERDLGRQKDQERLGSFVDQIDKSLFEP